MRKRLSILVLAVGMFFTPPCEVKSQGPNTTQINIVVNEWGGTMPCLLTLPTDYNSTSTKYALLIFAHGAGEGGNVNGSQLSNIYNSSGAGGPAYFIARNQWPTSFTNPANGQSYKFIVLSPQETSWSITPTKLVKVIDHMYANYRVDTNRLYLTGLSAGGQGIEEYVTHNAFTPIPHKAAASVIMSSASGMPTQAMCNAVIADNLRIWGFGSETDPLGINTHVLITGAYNGNGGTVTGIGALGRYTSYSGGHCCWNNFYNPTYKETIGGTSMNIYEWMLQFSRTSTPANTLPTANAGSDQAITLPTSSVTLNGSGTDSDGSIVSYSWSQISGVSATITNPTSASTSITGLTTAGTRVFRLTVTDNSGGTATDDVTITVNAGSGTTNWYLTPGYGMGWYQGDANTFTPGPGDTVFVNGAIEYGRMWFDGWNGTAQKPIVIINYNGQVRFKRYPETLGQSLLKITNSSHFKLVGIGDTVANKYGFLFKPEDQDVFSSHQSNIEIRTSSNYEISNVDILGGLIGMIIEDDAYCDPAKNFPNYINNNIDIHHSRMRRLWSQAVYAGNTLPDNDSSNHNTRRYLVCNGDTVYNQPSRMGNVHLHSLIVDSTGRPGLQLSSASFGYSVIEYNTVSHNGLQDNEQQGYGITFGAYTKGRISDNIISNTLADGISTIMADSTVTIRGNIIDSSGFLRGFRHMPIDGSVASFRGDTASYNVNTRTFPNNVTITSRDKLYNSNMKPIIRDNQFGKNKGGEVWLIANASVLRLDTAIICGNTATDGTVNVKTDNYSGGTPVYTLNTSCSGTNIPPTANAGADKSITLPTSSVSVTGSGSDIDGTISTYSWTQISGTTATISSPSSATTNITGLTTAGTRVFRLTVTDNGGATATDDVTIVVNPEPSTSDRYINVNVYGTALYNNSSWNNWNTVNSLTSAFFNYTDGTGSSINAVLSAQSGYSDNGDSYPVTIFPQQVGRDASWHNAPRTLTINGLSNSKLYDLSLFASRVTANQATRFTINGTTIQISTPNNYTNAANFTNITPTGGSIVIALQQVEFYNYINGFTITEKTVSGGGGNNAPTANAGANQTITLPTSSVTLSGSGLDSDGTIASYAWSQVSGTAATITSPTSASTTVTGLSTAGTRIFRLTVTDDDGATASSDVTVTVNSDNQAPIVSISGSKVLTLPTTTTQLIGTASDPDGSIVGYLWTQVSGPTVTIYTPTSANTYIAGLSTPGTYVLRLTATDNGGNSTSKDVTVTVNASVAMPTITLASSQSVLTTSTTVSATVTSSLPLIETKWTKFTVPGQSNKRITVIGSSTAFGTGPANINNSFVNKLKAYYKAEGIIDTIYNLAIGGTWPGDADITTALNKGAQVLLVNYPTNGFTTSNLAASIALFQKLKDSCDARGVQFYTTGTQPRDVYDSVNRLNLKVLNDSLRNRFGNSFIDFFTPMVEPSDNSIKPEFNSGDGTHLNDAAHEILFQLVRGANIFQNTISSATTIVSPVNNTTTAITGLSNGTHRYQLSIIDNRGYPANAVISLSVAIPDNPTIRKEIPTIGIRF